MKTIYYNGQVYTGQLPLQQAFAVEDGIFTSIGTDSELLSGEKENTVNLNGAFVCPGFNDSHMHLLNFGQTLTIAPLTEHTNSMSDLIHCMKQTPPGRGGWILGRGWNQDYFTDVSKMPNRYDLDQVSTQYPVCAIRACGHALSVNSKALEILNITSSTISPEGGEIVMERGTPNGIFFDNAMELIQSKIPAPTKEDLKKMILSACKALNTQGITSCHSDDYSTFTTLPWEVINEAYRELESENKLTVRVYEQANFTQVNSLENFIHAGNITGKGTDLFRIGPLKMLGDGALGARTAYLSEPYADDPTTRGLSVFTAQQFDQMIDCAHRNQMQVAVHCIGDACLDLVLNSLEKAITKSPRENHRHGIVHCQITREDQLHRISQNKLHIYMQSIFLDYDIHIVDKRVGNKRARTSYHWKILSDLGCTVSNGSDSPVEYPNVMAGIQCAVTRRTLLGTGPYLETEAFSVQEAIDSFTKAGAWGSFEEKKKGQIKKGMLADFVILNKNPFLEKTEHLKDIQIKATYLSGKCVYHV